MTNDVHSRIARVKELAAIIREVDGDHSLGAAELAEAILSHPRALLTPEAVEGELVRECASVLESLANTYPEIGEGQGPFLERLHRHLLAQPLRVEGEAGIPLAFRLRAEARAIGVCLAVGVPDEKRRDMIHAEARRYIEAADLIESLAKELTESKNALLKDKWVPVDERLPEKWQLVWVYYAYDPARGVVTQAKFEVRKGTTPFNPEDFAFHINGHDYHHEVVSHWQPLPMPEPPVKQGEEKL